MNKTLACQLILIFPVLLFSIEIKGIAETGQSVILHDNGKWEFDTLKAAIHTSPIDSCSVAKESSFRGTQWGQSAAQIRKIEKATIDEDISTSNVLVYKVSVCSLNAFLVYYFTNDKLYKANYVFDEEHSNSNLYIDDYNAIKTLLNNVYGDPKTDKRQWIDTLYKNDRSNHGTAVLVGHLKQYTIWKNGSTIVTMYLDGNRSKIRMGLEYLSKDLRSEAKKNIEYKALKDL